MYHVSTSEMTVGQWMVYNPSSARPHAAFFLEPPPGRDQVGEKYWAYRLVESVFEKIRSELADKAPSRRTALFTFPCKGCAEVFRDRSRGGGKVYLVEGRPDSVVMIADMKLRDAAAILSSENASVRESRGLSTDPEEATAQLARAYWTGGVALSFGGTTTVPEILMAGDMRVVEMEG